MIQDTVLFKSQNAARRRGKPSNPVLNFLGFENPPLTCKILDYGCGFGEDADYLQSLGYVCSRYDPHYFPTQITEQHDYVLCSYVLNVLPTVEERKEVISSVVSLAKSKAIFYVRNTIKTKSTRFSDGYYNEHTRVFNKRFSRSELETLFYGYNFKIKFYKNFYRIIVIPNFSDSI